MNQFEITKYYSRPEIQKAMIKIAKDREVVGSLRDGSFLSRPDILMYPKDIEERAKRGVVAFHCSVEKWTQPMQLSTGMNPKEMDNLRKGFDFILDIDAKAKLEHAIVGVRVAYNFFKDLGIKPTIKFSGSRGFHISISSNAFPEKIDFQETKNKYPEIPQTIADYLRKQIKEELLEELIAMEGGVASLVNTVPSVSKLSPYEFIELEKDWGNRHLFRMPYSLHPKFWLVSVPLKIENLKNFNRLQAKPENVKTNADFLVNKEGEATELLLKSLDWKAKQPKEIKKEIKVKRRYKSPIPEEYFPPCIRLILQGIPDGKKRSLFSLASFLRAMNWDQEKIEKRIIEWNKNNTSPLNERAIRTQLKWHSRQSRELMPANCKSSLFYTSIGVCKPDKLCGKNPVNYPFKLMKRNKKMRK